MNARTAVASLFSALLLATMWPAAGGAQQLESPAIAELRDCVAARQHLLVGMLIDESGSLGGTDPEALRVPALQLALSTLNVATNLGSALSSTTVEVLITGFSEQFEIRDQQWTDVNDASVGELENEIEAFRSRNVGQATNYQFAIAGMTEQMASRAAEVTATGADSPCRLMLFFTDGQLDLGDPESTASARTALCQPGGTVDQLRRTGAISVVVGLTTQLDPAASALLEATATGSGDTTTCGNPNSSSSGVYVPIDDFSQFTTLLASLLFPDGESCGPAGVACEREIRLDLAPGMKQVLIIANRSSPNSTITLESPNGSQLPLDSGAPPTASLSSAQLDQSWRGQNYVIASLLLPPGIEEWSGEWIIRLGETDLGSTSVSYWVFGSISAELTSPATLVSGEVNDIAVALVDTSGAPITSGSLFEETSITGTLTLPDGSTQPVDFDSGDTGFSSTIELEDSTDPGIAQLRVEVRTESRPRIELPPSSRLIELDVRVPGFPQVVNTSIQMPSITGTEPSQASLTIRGSTEGDGCIWFPAAGFEVNPAFEQGPVLSLDTSATSAEQCLEIQRNSTVTVPLSATLDSPVSGSAVGTIEVRSRSDASARIIEQDVDIALDLRREPKTGLGILAGVLFGLVAAAVPLAVVHAVNRSGARFAPSGSVAAAILDVEESNGDVSFDGSPRLSYIEHFHGLGDLGADTRARTVDLTAGGTPVTLSTIASASLTDRRFRLFSGPYGRAQLGTPQPFVAYDAAITLPTWVDRSGQTTAEVPLGLAGVWFAIPIESTEPGNQHYSVITFVSENNASRQIEQAEQNIRSVIQSKGPLSELTASRGSAEVGETDHDHFGSLE